MDFKPLIDKKDEAAKYMIDEITHICKDMDTRSPGTKGEKEACEYMAKVLKEDCGCERADVESFKENPGSFFGWIYSVSYTHLTLPTMLPQLKSAPAK